MNFSIKSVFDERDSLSKKFIRMTVQSVFILTEKLL